MREQHRMKCDYTIAEQPPVLSQGDFTVLLNSNWAVEKHCEAKLGTLQPATPSCAHWVTKLGVHSNRESRHMLRADAVARFEKLSEVVPVWPEPRRPRALCRDGRDVLAEGTSDQRDHPDYRSPGLRSFVKNTMDWMNFDVGSLEDLPGMNWVDNGQCPVRTRYQIFRFFL